MKAYVVTCYDEGVYGVYTTKEKAEKAKKDAQQNAEMRGYRVFYGIKTFILDKDGKIKEKN